MVLLRYRDPSIKPLLDEALSALAATDRFLNGWIGRSPDDADLWVLGARWADAGALRRGLGSYPAKLALGPLQAFSSGDDSVVEILAENDGTTTRSQRSDLAGDAREAAPLGQRQPD